MAIEIDVVGSLVSSSIVRRCFLANASSNAPPARKSDSMPQIKVALCIQRYASLSPEMTPLEKEYSNLLGRLETDNSYLSDHELRHKTEMYVFASARYMFEA